MGHSRQGGGFADFSSAPLTSLAELPETARAGLESLRPDIMATLPDTAGFVPFKPVKPPKSEGGRAQAEDARFQRGVEHGPTSTGPDHAVGLVETWRAELDDHARRVRHAHR